MTKRTASILLIAMVAFACRKNDRFNYQDGTPGDGEASSSITVDTSVKKVDVSKYAQARVFPGLVCNTEPRLNNVQLAMNLNYNFVGEDLRINVPPQPQFSTGLYAAPGELVIIDVPEGEYSLSIQIGAWTDNLSGIQNPPRDPIIYSKSQLAPGRNYMRNLYGGHIYIYAGKPIVAPVNLVFSNIIKSPDFVLGETTNEQWKTALQNSCVPWLELRSKNMVFVVPREYLLTRPIEDPTTAMQMWDDILKIDYYEWEGLQENAADPVDKAPLLPWRCVLDIKPVAGYGHSGFPIVVQNDYSWFGGIENVINIDGGGNWGYFHEIGHNNQQPRYWSWSSLGETSNNLFAFKVANRLSAISPTAWPPRHPALADAMPRAIEFAKSSGTKNFDGTDTRIDNPFSRLTPFVQIFDKVPAGLNYDGWGFMTELYKKARRSNRISLNDQNKRDFVYETICDYTQRDWIFFFNAWGINISNIASGKIAAKYPVMNQKIWEYNPLTRTGGDATFNPDPFDPSNWKVSSFSSEEPTGEGPPNGLASSIIDGNVNTFWHSQWGATQANPPHQLVVDMGRSLTINGFVFNQRQGGATNIMNLRVETSSDGSTWTAVAGSPFSLARVNERQTKGLPAPVSCRYFRLTVPANGDVYSNNQFAALAEVNVLKNPDPYYRGNWTVSFSTQEPTGEGPPNGLASATIDGKIGTFWHSEWNAASPSPPHVLTYDMGQSLDVKGFVFTQRQATTGNNIKNILVETSNDGTTWTGVTGSTFALAQDRKPQAKSIPAVVNCRFVRITVPGTADTYNGGIYASLAEFDVYHP